MLFVVDARAGVTPGDEELAHDPARARTSRCSCSRTRSTTRRRTTLALEFHRLGLGDPFPLSALHGHGTGDLLDAVVAAPARRRRRAQVGDEAIRVAILGRPNVGKSSLLNALARRRSA